MYIPFIIEVLKEFIRGMFSIKIVCSCMSLLFFQINPTDTYNSEEYVSSSYTTSLFLSLVQPIDMFPQIIEIQFLDLYLPFFGNL